MKTLEKMQQLAAQPHSGYTQEGLIRKKEMHRQAKKFLRELAAMRGMAKGDYDLRSNMAGPAVSGEITLHSDTLYVQVGQSPFAIGGMSLLVRGCRGRGDYSGLTNHCLIFKSLDVGSLLDLLEDCHKEAVRSSQHVS